MSTYGINYVEKQANGNCDDVVHIYISFFKKIAMV